MIIRQATAAVMLFSMTACSSVRPLARPTAYIEQNHPTTVWVADTAGEVLRMSSPAVRGDSIFGRIQGTDEAVSVQLTPEHAVFARQKSPGKTAELVGSLALMGGLFVYGYVKSQNGPEDCASQGANPTGRPYC